MVPLENTAELFSMVPHGEVSIAQGVVVLERN